MSQLFCIEKNFLVLCFHKMNFPVFPLNGAILFPNTNLPLNIFENRYIDMVDYALSNNRLIGMIQTKKNKELFTIGCLGKITNFTETSDKRYLAASKHAVHGFSETLRQEYAGKGIRVSEILPGMVRTGFAATRFSDSDRGDAFYDAYGQCLEAKDIARCIMLALKQPPHAVIAQMVVAPDHD